MSGTILFRMEVNRSDVLNQYKSVELWDRLSHTYTSWDTELRSKEIHPKVRCILNRIYLNIQKEDK